MNEKIISVYFDRNGLPYKDRELTTHFPIIGSGFLGASNTTKIRFYFENIGVLNDTYLAVSKLTNGKQGSQLLNIKSSDENGQYAELSLSEWYFQAKGDVFVGLKVYRGGVDVTVDEETGFSIVSGDPVIMVTGSIKLAINYAPIGDVPDYRDEFTAYNDILALMREKPDIDTVPLLVNFSDYATWSALYEYVGTRPFIAYVNGVLSVCAIESETEDNVTTYKLLVNNSTGIFRTSTFALDSAIGDEYGAIAFEQYELKADNCIDLPTGTSGTLTSEQQQLIGKPNAYIRKDFNSIYHKASVDTFFKISLVEYTDYVTLFTGTIVIDTSSSPYTWTETNKTTNIYKKEKVDSLVSGLETKINASGHTISVTIDNQTYVMTIALKDKNNNIISTQQIDLPLESIVTSAAYYDTYTYEGVTYEKVIVIVLATTPVPTIVPVGSLVEGLITEETLNNTLKDYVKDVEITSVKTVAEVLEEIGGNNHIFSFDLMGIKYLGLFVDGEGTDIDLELWSPSGTSKVESIDTTQLFRTEMSNYVVESAYFPIVAISQPITTLSDEQMTILGQDNSFIVYNGRVYVKSNDTGTNIEFVCPDIDDTSANGYHTQSKYEIIINKPTKGAVVLGSTNYYYDRSQTDNLLLGKQNLLVSGTNIKTINNQDILGSGNIDISGSGATWGSITGTLSDQTDLQNELQKNREIAEGKCATYVIDYADTIENIKEIISGGAIPRKFYAYNTTTKEFEDKTTELLNGEYDSITLANSLLNSDNNSVSLSGAVVFREKQDLINSMGFLYIQNIGAYATDKMKLGDIILVAETPVPDRWVASLSLPIYLYKLETSKVDLDNYYTKTESDENVVKNQATTAIVKDALTNINGRVFQTYTATLITSGYTYYLIQKNGANLTKADAIEYMNYMTGSKFVPEYNYDFPRNTYFIFEDTTIWKPQFDTTNGLLLYKVSDGYVDITSAQTITGIKTFSNGIELSDSDYSIYVAENGVNIKANSFAALYIRRNAILPANAYGVENLGGRYNKWQDLYISGGLRDGNSNYKLTIPNTTSWTADKVIATTDQIIGKYVSIMDAPTSTTLTDEQIAQIEEGVFINGEYLGYKNPIICPCVKGVGILGYGLIVGTIGGETKIQGYILNYNTKYISLYPTLLSFQGANLNIKGKSFPSNPSDTGTFVNKMINGTWSWENEIPTSVSLTDGGTISDTTLQGLIIRQQPIVLNGFTCYFSCDDGTNYQYVNTRYDSSANKNHINVITINKTTWVATFHTSDIALS